MNTSSQFNKSFFTIEQNNHQPQNQLGPWKQLYSNICAIQKSPQKDKTIQKSKILKHYSHKNVLRKRKQSPKVDQSDLPFLKQKSRYLVLDKNYESPTNSEKYQSLTLQKRIESPKKKNRQSIFPQINIKNLKDFIAKGKNPCISQNKSSQIFLSKKRMRKKFLDKSQDTKKQILNQKNPYQTHQNTTPIKTIGNSKLVYVVQKPIIPRSTYIDIV